MKKLISLTSTVLLLILVTVLGAKTKFSLVIPEEHINVDTLQQFRYLMVVRFRYLFDDPEITDQLATIVINLYDNNTRYVDLSNKDAEELTPEEQNELYEILISSYGELTKQVFADANITMTFDEE